MHRAFVLSSSEYLTVDDFGWIALQVRRPEGAVARPAGSTRVLVADSRLFDGGYEGTLESYDRQLIVAGLTHCNGRIRETARFLGIARNTLRAKMKRYGMAGNGEDE